MRHRTASTRGAALFAVLSLPWIAACGNKGELYLPGSLEDEARIRLIDVDSDDADPISGSPTAPTPATAPGPAVQDAIEDADRDDDGAENGDDAENGPSSLGSRRPEPRDPPGAGTGTDGQERL